MEIAALVFAGFASVVMLIIIGSLLRGWVLSIVWTWFMVPLGAPHLSIPLAIGVALIVSFLTHQSIREPQDKRDFSEKVGSILGSILSPFIVLGFAWCVKQFV